MKWNRFAFDYKCLVSVLIIYDMFNVHEFIPSIFNAATAIEHVLAQMYFEGAILPELIKFNHGGYGLFTLVV